MDNEEKERSFAQRCHRHCLTHMSQRRALQWKSQELINTGRRTYQGSTDSAWHSPAQSRLGGAELLAPMKRLPQFGRVMQ